MIKIQRAVECFKKYADAELLPLMSDLKRFGAGVYLDLAAENFEHKIEQYKDHMAVEILELIHDDEVDIDKLYEVMARRFNGPMVLPIPILGEFKISRSDLDKLYAMMRR